LMLLMLMLWVRRGDCEHGWETVPVAAGIGLEGTGWSMPTRS
jgi:hypothetical protein